MRGNQPTGIHQATWNELETRYGTTDHRRQLLAGLKQALESLRDAGCLRAYIDGSFVTSKHEPADFDGCWEARAVDPARVDPVLLDFSAARRAQKAKFGGELFRPRWQPTQREGGSSTTSSTIRTPTRRRALSRSI